MVGGAEAEEGGSSVTFTGGGLLGDITWLVPSAILAIPVLVIVIAIVVQLVAGVVYISIARRSIRYRPPHG